MTNTANLAVTVVFAHSPSRQVQLELVEFQSGWFKLVDPSNRNLGPVDHPAESVTYLGPARPPRGQY